MTITLALIAGLALACAFIAGCIVGHRVAGSEMSDSAQRWESTYADAGMVNPPMENETWYYVGGGRFAVRPDTKPEGPPLRKV